MSTPEKYVLNCEGSTLYALNSAGVNAFCLNVQRGKDDRGVLITERQCELIAVAIKYVLDGPNGQLVDFEPIVNTVII